MGHHPGMTMAGEGIDNALLPGWAILLIIAAIVLGVWLIARWWKRL